MTGNADVGLARTPSQFVATNPLWQALDESADAGSAGARSRVWTWRYLRRVLIADSSCALTAGVVAIVVSGAVPLRDSIPLPYVLIVLGSPFAWVLAVAGCHGYERRYLGNGTEEYRALAAAAIRLLAMSAFVSYAIYVDRPYLARSFVLVYFPVLLGTVLIARYALRKHLHWSRWHGHSFHRAVVVGREDAVRGLISDLHREPVHGFLPVAVCTPGSAGVDELAAECGVGRHGSLHEAVQVVEESAADVVVVASPSGLDGLELRRLSWELDDLGTELIVAPGVVEVTGPRMSIRPAANLSLLHIERPALHGLNALNKATFDRLLAGALLVLLSPVFALVAVLIKVRDGGSVFFRQTRVGIDGRDFSMLKFRSMVPDAEAKFAQVKADADDGNGVLFKRREDPRITRVGRVLRRYSLDELPQLLNVARGEMSIVGPRPPLRGEVEMYGADAIRRLRVKPGLTGLWQVSGRSDLSWDESLRLDLRYVDNWSMTLDLQILWRTFRAVIRGTGAY